MAPRQIQSVSCNVRNRKKNFETVVMRSIGLLEAKIIPKLRTTGNYCQGCYICGCGGGLMVGVGAVVVGGDAIVVGGDSFLGGFVGSVCTGDGFQRSLADFTT